MDFVRNSGKTWVVLFWMCSLPGVVQNADEATEPSERIGNYTIWILAKSPSPGSELMYRLFGEGDTGFPQASRAVCKESTITFTDVADIGRICAIGLRLSNGASCKVTKVLITDNTRREQTVLDVESSIKPDERYFTRPDKIRLAWQNWGEWDKCNCTTETQKRTRTCSEVSEQCQGVTFCDNPKTEQTDCECEDATGKGSEEEASLAIPVIGSIAGVLFVLVVVAICYSRWLNKRKAEEAMIKHISNPIIIVSPPEESEDEAANSLLENDPGHSYTQRGRCELVTPEKYQDDDVIGRPKDGGV